MLEVFGWKAYSKSALTVLEIHLPVELESYFITAVSVRLIAKKKGDFNEIVSDKIHLLREFYVRKMTDYPCNNNKII